ncbi:alpha/beta-hydrolase [Hesseltinella vesiculosa]|uniref:Alpha/beta-hydrolase n=1 Tax=Hesseltinella vesiculosa TaxID=101127 RepID=A0A1X2GMF1_9FUNG|nr:alpha/beta-hydrolase [Hesseltinella vesiculosa]
MSSTVPIYMYLSSYLQHTWNSSSLSSSAASLLHLFRTDAKTPQQTNRVRSTPLPCTPTVSSYTPSTLAVSTLNLMSPVTPRYRIPRAPIVLCHGLYGFDRMGPDSVPALQVHYWNEIEKALKDMGCQVVITSVPKTESISKRAYTLHSVLSSLTSHRQINLVAHSMGGLDCRYLLSHIKQRSYRVNSLSTICTPHRGSSLTNWFRDTVGVAQMVDNQTTLQQQRLFAQWFDTPAYANLTTDYCDQIFNPSTPDDPMVSYYSYTARATVTPWSSLLFLPWQLIHQAEGDNDGIVSVKSGQWGQHVKTVDADHWDFTGKSVIPYRLKDNDFDRAQFYVELAHHLYEQGH